MSTKVISGDSLEEDFLLEEGFVYNSEEDEGLNLGEGEIINNSILLEEEDDETSTRRQPITESEEGLKRKKRKLDLSGSNLTPVGGTKPEKKVKKLKETFNENSISLGLLSLEELIKTLAEKQKFALPNLSSIELEDLRITESMIVDTSSILDRKSLMSFIRDSVPTLPSTLSKPPKKPGCPRVLIISGAALRVADLCREVKIYKTKEIDIAKLFSKHFKIGEHVDYLSKTKIGIAVGVPGRIGKLFNETEALSLTHLSHLILDTTHLDSKKRSLLDLSDSREDLFKFVLGFKPLMDRLREGRMKLIFW